MNPMVGRFISVDPLFVDIGNIDTKFQYRLIKNPPESNIYSYTSNNPIKYIDSMGLWSFWAGMGIGWGPSSIEEDNQDMDLKNLKRDYQSRFVGAYLGTSKETLSNSSSLNAGSIKTESKGWVLGAAFGGGPVMGFDFGTVEDLKKGVSESKGILLGPFSIETLNNSNDLNKKWPTGIQIGFLNRGFGLGFIVTKGHTTTNDN